MAKFATTISEGLYNLTEWQVGSPIANEYLRGQPVNEVAIGGVMNGKANPAIRIDVVQHQMHAVILALRYVYK